jgi:DNA-binding transcriptional MerR regulator
MVEPYVLRFWESEFPQLHPNKSGTGQRLYRKRDVEMALRVKRLLYDEGYTIAGARQIMLAETRNHKAGQSELPLDQRQALEKTQLRLHKARKELREILGLLSTVQAPSSERKPAPRPATGRRLFET